MCERWLLPLSQSENSVAFRVCPEIDYRQAARKRLLKPVAIFRLHSKRARLIFK
jgi:hypothetical protein